MEPISKLIQNTIPNLKYRVFDTDILFKELNLPNSKKSEALKALLRLERANEITRLINGVYFKTEVSKVTKKHKSVLDNEIIRYYTKDKAGFTIGYDLYNRKNISTQISKKKTILSSILKKDTRTMKSITVKKVSINLNTRTQEFIEILEIIENSSYIQDFNEKGFYKLVENFVENYDYNTMNYILKAMNYKKQTIYNIHNIMKMFGKDSELEEFLNVTSSYQNNKAYEAISSQKKKDF